jgi:hypothetical protein
MTMALSGTFWHFLERSSVPFHHRRLSRRLRTDTLAVKLYVGYFEAPRATFCATNRRCEAHCVVLTKIDVSGIDNFKQVRLSLDDELTEVWWAERAVIAHQCSIYNVPGFAENRNAWIRDLVENCF